MEEKLLNLWNNHRTVAVILGLLLLPLTLLMLGLKVYMLLNEKAAENSLKDAQKKDDKLSAEESELKKKADEAMAEANKAAQRVVNRHEEDAVDLDWNKKRND